MGGRGVAARRQRAAEALAALGFSVDDVEEHFVAAAKPGGQNVNKTATCVCLSHRPSRIQIKCQDERSQAANRSLAWERLAQALLARRERERAAVRQTLEKARRQKRKRSAQAKENMLEAKRKQSQKKLTRRKVQLREI